MTFTNFNLEKRVTNYEKSQIFGVYTRVDVVMGEDTEGNIITVSYPSNVPDSAGRVLTVDMPMCTNTTLAQTAAQRIYDSLQNKDPLAFQYQPMQADGALADPSMEFGDSVDINGVHSGFYTRQTNFGRLMKSNLSSPTDEEIDHEYPYQDAQQRQITRTNKEYRAGLYVNSQAITAEVTARQNADTNVTNTLRSELTQTATSINATVSAETAARQAADNTKLNHTNTSQAFGWSLTSTAFQLKNNNTPVFQFDANGLAFKSNGSNVFTVTRTGGLYVKGNGEFTGTITATGGTIGGITLNGSYGLYTNGKTSSTSTQSGFLISKGGGIYVGAYNSNTGACPFQVTSSGALTATSGKIGGFSIGSSSIYNGKTSVGADTTSGVFVGTGGIALGNGTANHVFRVTSAGAMTVKYGMESLSDTTNNGVYIGTDGMAFGKGNFKVTSGGTIYAKSGVIGNFNIGSSSLWNGMTSLSDTTNNGVYLGTNGIACGKGAFKVTSSGAVTASNLKINGGSINIGTNFSVSSTGNVSANNMTLTGTLTIGGSQITASQLQQGAYSAYTNGGTWSAGAGYGYAYNYATNQNSGSYPGFFRATQLYCNTATLSYLIDRNNYGRYAAWRYLQGADGNYYYFLCGAAS